jgi:hypothetical protein
MKIKKTYPVINYKIVEKPERLGDEIMSLTDRPFITLMLRKGRYTFNEIVITTKSVPNWIEFVFDLLLIQRKCFQNEHELFVQCQYLLEVFVEKDDIHRMHSLYLFWFSVSLHSNI